MEKDCLSITVALGALLTRRYLIVLYLMSHLQTYAWHGLNSQNQENVLKKWNVWYLAELVVILEHIFFSFFFFCHVKVTYLKAFHLDFL